MRRQRAGDSLGVSVVHGQRRSPTLKLRTRPLITVYTHKNRVSSKPSNHSPTVLGVTKLLSDTTIAGKVKQRRALAAARMGLSPGPEMGLFLGHTAVAPSLCLSEVKQQMKPAKCECTSNLFLHKFGEGQTLSDLSVYGGTEPLVW
ncbi:hypothetical protein EVAR_61371_1 [Eumeta japonica]|uniref:Uncharacterized protein n=1 Tax=Eumeta variegata TaxID=151549 RepID=A0A4C1Z8G8_EUMVA|nr:hypothetical protein EVAR_61371_1 [Eumeta japonica]